MNDNKIFKLLEEQKKFTKNGRVRCNCGRQVNIENITYIHPIDMNYFKLWCYELKNDNTTKMIVRNKPWGYIGHIPILKDIVFRLYQLFHKKAYVLDIECKYCEKVY